MGLTNPFPGLRPFEPEEDHLFFGRETEIDSLLRRLRSTRCLAVVGTSGSGKSSLIRSGLIPALQSGYMAGASSSWRIAILRPGADPIGNLAASLSRPDVLGIDPGGDGPSEQVDLAETNRILVEATLRRSPRGLADAVRQARMPGDDNVLVVVDQFEELFRFRRSRNADSHDEAVAFARLLVEAARQQDVPVYVVLTLRSDFIGDCMDFPGLADAVNAGMYLVGRMSRDALRLAVTGPVAVAGATIAPRLVNRVLNDLGDDPDQLPLAQHALMRTFEHWERTRRGTNPEAPIDIEDYDAIGTIRDALSRHAEEAYQEAVAHGGGRLVEHLFKALTDTVSDARGVRRPTSIEGLAAVSGVPEAQVLDVVEMFRRKGRSFLMPPPPMALGSGSVIDLSHESLMRCWPRLIAWADEERASAGIYQRLSKAAGWFDEGAGGLWRNPELELAVQWRRDAQPTAAWAHRYDERFERAVAFLDRSLEQRDREGAREERERRATLQRAWWTAGVLATFLVVAVSLAYYARRESGRAEANLALARAAVDESLSSADRDPAAAGNDVPQVDELRRELLAKAESFYRAFLSQAPNSEASRRDLAFAHFRLGHIDRMLEKSDAAVGEYRDAIRGFEALASSYPANVDYRAALANAYNWLGETLRPIADEYAEAEKAYDRAFVLQQVLVRDAGPSASGRRHQQELARTHYNRGILRAMHSLTAGQAALGASADRDFREAIRLLEPLAAADDAAAQELARAYNNLGGLIDQADTDRSADVRSLWERAIAIGERLAASDPLNRQVRVELAQYCSNAAVLLHQQGDLEAALRRGRQAVDLFEGLSRPSPSVAVLQADAHSLRGTILEDRDAVGARAEYAVALDQFARLYNDVEVRRLPSFQLRFADLLLNLAELPGPPAEAQRARQLLGRAVGVYTEMAGQVEANGSRAEVQAALDNIARVLPALPEGERMRLAPSYQRLQRKIAATTSLR